jgi:hypothetical protein
MLVFFQNTGKEEIDACLATSSPGAHVQEVQDRTETVKPDRHTGVPGFQTRVTQERKQICQCWYLQEIVSSVSLTQVAGASQL